MSYQQAVRIGAAVAAVAVAVAMGGFASPAVAEARVGVGATLHDREPSGDRIAGVERRAGPFRGGYQLRLGEARKLLSA